MEPTTRRWALVVVIALAILVVSVVPIPDAVGRPLGPVGLDSWLHALGFACLAATVLFALEPSSRLTFRFLLLVTGAVIGYGVAIELIQVALPYRRFAVADSAADTVGAIVGAGSWRLLRPRAGVVLRRY